MRWSALFLLFIAPQAFAEAPLNGIASSLTLYAYPPAEPIDWSSPGTSLRSTFSNIMSGEIRTDDLVKFENDLGEKGTLSSRYRSSIGHTITHTRCILPNGKLYDHWASLSGQNLREVDNQTLFKDKIGAGVLFYQYPDGHIIEGAENVKRLTFNLGARDWASGSQVHPRYLQLELDPQRCEAARKMVTFFESYHYAPDATLAQLEARGVEGNLYFTNSIDPYQSYVERTRSGHGKVGGGCAPFAAGLVKAVGRYESEMDTLWRTPVDVSEKLIGGWYDPHLKEIRRVSVVDLMFGSLGSRWTYDDEGYKNRHLDMYDPQRIWQFSGDVSACLEKGACSTAAGKTFVSRHRGDLRKGATQVFRDSIEFDVQKSEFEHETHTQDVEQPVDGFVWRLPPGH